MKKSMIQLEDLVEAGKAYLKGENITQLLRQRLEVESNTPEIIEIAYDLQAGTYIDEVAKSTRRISLYTSEIAKIIDDYLHSSDKLLDVGAGELTILSPLIAKLKTKPAKVFALDVSFSRLFKGLNYAQANMGESFHKLKTFVADIGAIPLMDKSINVTTSNQALEPNGSNLKKLLLELFRVTIDKLILIEPCYEINTLKGKQRMDRLGYIKNIESTLVGMGAQLLDKIRIKHFGNPLNPLVCFIVKPPNETNSSEYYNEKLFAVPGSNMPLQFNNQFYYSVESGLHFPVLEGIPVLKQNCAILASALVR